MTRKKAPSVNDTADVHLGGAVDSDDTVSLMTTASGGLVFAPRSIRNASPAARELCGRLQTTVAQISLLQQALDEQLEEGRGLGLSWEALGWCLGLTGEAVRKRFTD